jgi:predicted phage terminase large subunit-like protein
MNESRLPARQIEDWPPHLERRLLHAFQREDFEAFLHRAFCVINPGQEYTRSWHISAIAHKLDKVRLGESKRLIIAMPPRHLKSITVSIAFPAFLLGHDPSMRIIGASYADSLAAAHSNDFRRLIESQPYKRLFPKTRIDPAKNTEAEVRTTQRGFRLATSVGGSLTGRGGQLIIIDDPLKPDEAASAPARRRAIDWYEKTVTSRLDHKGEGAIILVMQRLHVDDLAGHLLEGGGWDYLGLPAIADIEEAIPLTRGRVYIRRPGELLFPARESMTVLDQLKREMGSYAFSAQYQQEPVPLGGGLIQWAWFRFYDEDNLPRYPAEEIVISWDTASKSNELSDYSVGTVWARYGDRYFLLDVVRGKYGYPELRGRVISTAEKYKDPKIIIESAGSGIALAQDLTAEGLKISAINPVGDKVMRMSAQTARIEEGRVFIPKSAPWLKAFHEELLGFPYGKHDDQVDSLAQALAWFTRPVRRVCFG